MCLTLDHLLCPAGTAAVKCSVLPGAAPQPRGSGWEGRGSRGGAALTPGPRASKHRAAALLRLAAAQAAIGPDLGFKLLAAAANAGASLPLPEQAVPDPAAAYAGHLRPKGLGPPGAAQQLMTLHRPLGTRDWGPLMA